MRRPIVIGLLTLALCGCDRVGIMGWHPAPDDKSYGTYTYEPAVNNGCSEHETEVTAEVDNQGHLCTSVVP
jgi:hypothetical protein